MVDEKELRDAMIAANITEVDHHDCGFCGYMVRYVRDGNELFFDPGCHCSRYGCAPMEPNAWGMAASWINMQNPEWQKKLKQKFGLT